MCETCHLPSKTDSFDTAFSEREHFFMACAIDQAKLAWQAGEVPVGAVIVFQDQIIATGYNQVISCADATAHAEIVAIRNACLYFDNYRLPDCQLYVTLEPCLMCAGTIFNARLDRVIYGAKEPKTGVCGSVINAFDFSMLNFHTSITGGLIADSCSQLLSDFFAERRQQQKDKKTQKE